MRWRFTNFARPRELISLCPGFLLFALHPRLCLKFGQARAGVERRIRIWDPAVNLVESCLFCALTLPRSATSASVKIDAYASTYNHNCRTSSIHTCTCTRDLITHIETDRPLSADLWSATDGVWQSLTSATGIS